MWSNYLWRATNFSVLSRNRELFSSESGSAEYLKGSVRGYLKVSIKKKESLSSNRLWKTVKIGLHDLN